jgi:hypothetical protein
MLEKKISLSFKLLAVLSFFFLYPITNQAQTQTQFGAEEAIENPAKIPVPILKQLQNDKRVKMCTTRVQKFKSNWFSAAEIDLNGDQVSDYVVKAENPCLFGANIAPFWVFHNLTTRYSLVLHDNTLALEILPVRTEDYHNIKLSKASANQVFEKILKFDGARYR